MFFANLRINLLAAVAASCVLATNGHAQAEPAEAPSAKPASRAARSVHLWWDAPQGMDFYNEMTVEQSTPGSYFMACGFAHGYFGIQELAGGRGIASDGGKAKKVVIFSIWDNYKGDDAKAVPAEKRVELLHQDPDVRIGRFGGEGTGGQSFFSYPWEIGEECKFLVRAKVEGNKTSFSGYFFLNKEKRWKHLVTFRTITGGKPLSGYYSFLEDFRRDGKSPNETRRATYSNGWVRTLDGHWQSLDKARFTADKTPLDNINAALQGDGSFLLTTGGDVEQKTKLQETLERPRDESSRPPEVPAE